VLHMPRAHVPHPHVHPRFEEHPWRVLPVALFVILLLSVALIGASFAIAKAVTGHAY
jgi:hypothetical protein